MKANKSFKSFFRRKMSIEFKIIGSCLTIMVFLSFIVSITTIRNFNNYVDNNANSMSNEISKQIVLNYDNYIDSIIETFDIATAKLANTDVVNEIESVQNYFTELLDYRTDISSIILFKLDGTNLVGTNDFKPDPNIDIRTMPWFYEAVNQPTVPFFAPPFLDSDGENKIYVTKYISYNFNDDKGVLLIELNSDKIINITKNTNLGEGGQILILNSNYQVIYISSTDFDDGMIKHIKKEILGTSIVKIGNKRYSANIKTLDNTRWKLGIFINIDDSALSQKNFAISLVVISLIFIMVTAVIVLFISRSIANPLKKLEYTMKEIEEADYLLIEEAEIGNQKEIANLSESFNLMMKKIKDLMDKVVEEQKAQRASELKALQNQINPHFLYNTLDSIVWLIDNEKNKEASEMVVALAKLFRISISRGRNIITVKDELAHARSYLLIQSIRYADAFKYELDVDDEVVEYTTMKLILQPLIENSIYHGLKNRVDEGKIKISAHIVDNKIVFKVSDNGYGMKQEKIDQLYTNFRNPNLNDGVGLKNVYLRLKIYYGDEADLKIESELDEGTTIIILIPLKTNSQQVENK